MFVHIRTHTDTQTHTRTHTHTHNTHTQHGECWSLSVQKGHSIQYVTNILATNTGQWMRGKVMVREHSTAQGTKTYMFYCSIVHITADPKVLFKYSLSFVLMCIHVLVSGVYCLHCSQYCWCSYDWSVHNALMEPMKIYACTRFLTSVFQWLQPKLTNKSRKLWFTYWCTITSAWESIVHFTTTEYIPLTITFVGESVVVPVCLDFLSSTYWTFCFLLSPLLRWHKWWTHSGVTHPTV